MYKRGFQPIEKDAALVRIERMCVRAERCEYEIRAKLRNWGVIGDIDLIIADLRKRRFVDDARFAEAFVRDKYRFNSWGRIKIKNALRLKHIAPDIIDSAMQAVDEDEYLDILRRLVQARIARGDERQTIIHSLYSRGYEPAITAEIIDAR